MPFDPVLLKQLIESFYTELDEHAQVIIKGLLALEKNNLSQDDYHRIIKDIFRSAHNIKGTSRGLGVMGVGEIAHRIESLFTEIQKTNLTITHEVIDLCLDAVDKMKLVLDSFVEKKDLTFNLEELLAAFEINKLFTDHEAYSESLPIEKKSENNHPKKTETTKTQEVDDEASAIANETPQKGTVNIKDDTTKQLNIMVDNNPIKPKQAQKHTSIRVPVERIEKITSVLEEIQVSKIAIVDHYAEMNKLENKAKQFSFLWKKLLGSLEKNMTPQVFSNYKSLCDSNNDSLLELYKIIQHINSSMQASVNELSLLSHALQDEIGQIRMIPIGNLLCNFPRYVRDLSNALNKNVELVITGDEVKVDKVVLEGLNDPIIHLLRNAIDHGIETTTIRREKGKIDIGQITIDIKNEEGQIIIDITDDGGGIDVNKIASIAEYKKMFTAKELKGMSDNEKLNLIFAPGFSTKEIISDISGRGVGLDIVKANIEDLQGHIKVTTSLGEGSTFTLSMPVSIASERGLLIRCENQYFVLPLIAVERVLSLSLDELLEIQGHQAIVFENRAMPLTKLSDILQLKNQMPVYKDKLSIVIIKKRGKAVALLVDEIVSEREIVVKQLQPPLSKVSCIAGGTLLESNQVILVLEPSDLIQHALKQSEIRSGTRVKSATEKNKLEERIQILVVDDSITTRTLEKSILESKNYQVTLAVNGKEALDILQKKKFALVITDVIMPIMDGFTLTEQIKKNDNLRDMPVIIVTSLGSEAEKKRGIDVGADAYIVKNEFESGSLLEIVAQLV